MHLHPIRLGFDSIFKSGLIRKETGDDCSVLVYCRFRNSSVKNCLLFIKVCSAKHLVPKGNLKWSKTKIWCVTFNDGDVVHFYLFNQKI